MRSLSTIRDLAGGRMPPITRTALATSLGVFLLTLLVFHPHAGGEPAATPLRTGVLLVPPGDARTESLVLLDTSVAYLPGRLAESRAGQGAIGQPMEAPFAPFSPVLLVDPGKYDVGKMNDRLPLEAPKASAPAPTEAIPLSQWEPYTTLGTKGFKTLEMVSRGAFYEIYPIGGARKAIISGKVNHPGVIFGDLSPKVSSKTPQVGVVEVQFGVDSMGMNGPGSVIRTSGSPALDKAILQWAAGVDWARQLPPGTYRVQVGP